MFWAWKRTARNANSGDVTLRTTIHKRNVCIVTGSILHLACTNFWIVSQVFTVTSGRGWHVKRTAWPHSGVQAITMIQGSKASITFYVLRKSLLDTVMVRLNRLLTICHLARLVVHSPAVVLYGPLRLRNDNMRNIKNRINNVLVREMSWHHVRDHANFPQENFPNRDRKLHTKVLTSAVWDDASVVIRVLSPPWSTRSPFMMSGWMIRATQSRKHQSDFAGFVGSL